MTAVYRNFSQAGLDAAYNNRAVEPGLAAIKGDWDRRSQALYACARVSRDLAYGAGPRQRLDFFHARTAGRPTFMFIHGGYWQGNEKEPHAFVAAGLLTHDINVALVEYTLAPQARMSGIVAEIAASIGWLTPRLEPELGAGRALVVCGHSAGGHLTAMAAGLPGVTAALPVSGLFDLEPIRLSYLNQPLKMTLTEASANSPLSLVLPRVPVTVAVGDAELPELVRQSRDYAAALKAAGRPVRELVLPGDNHFSILEQLARADGTLCTEALRLASGNLA
ncbi:MAG: alpha/beta hydrolase [Betaproteobacteria bacterium]|nr:alpha/beta hydrolase [Betaproteobacteria bacterium]